MFATLSLSNGRKVQHHIPALLFCLFAGIPALAMAKESMTKDAAPASASEVSASETLVSETPASENASPSDNKKRGSVARAIFTTAIADREPVDNLDTVSNSTQRVYFFSDLRGLAGQIVTHRWEYNDKVMAEVTFKVGDGARWRVYSSKNLLPEWTGQWSVIVSDESGWPLKISLFEYTAESAVEAPAASAP